MHRSLWRTGLNDDFRKELHACFWNCTMAMIALFIRLNEVRSGEKKGILWQSLNPIIQDSKFRIKIKHSILYTRHFALSPMLKALNLQRFPFALSDHHRPAAIAPDVDAGAEHVQDAVDGQDQADSFQW
jgi:hypothetical protein